MKKKSKRQTRRLSVKEQKRTAKDVSNWVDTTQPSRKKEDEVRLRERKEDTYVSQETVFSDKSEDLVEEPKRLDGGYAWAIVCFSFLLHFIADGLTFSFGQMFHSIVKKFDVNRMFGATIAGLFLSLPLMSSPFASVIGEHLGCRLQLIGGLIVSIFGIFMALLGLSIESIVIFMVGFSVFLALGLALVYNGAIVILNLFFDKRLGLATALAVSGTGIGTIVFPQVIGQFENYFPGESATCTCILVLVLCIIALVICVFFIRDVEWTSDSVEYKRRMFEKRVRKLDRERGDEEDCYEPEEENYYARKSTSLPCVFNLKEARGSLIELGTSMQSIRDSVSIIKQVQPPVPRSRSVGTFLRNKNLPNVPEYSMLHAEDFNHLDHLDLHLGHSPANTVHSKQPSRVRMLSKTSMSVDAINDMNDDAISKAKSCLSDSEDDGDTETESDTARSNDGVSSDSELSDKNGILKSGTTLTNGIILNVPPHKLDTSRQTRPSLGVSHQAPGRILVGRTGYRVRINTNLLGSQLKMPSAPLIFHRKPKWHEKHEHLGHLWKALCSLPRQFPLYLDMLKNDLTCCVFALSVSCLYMVLDVPYVFYYDHAVENLNFTQSEGSDLTTALGLSNLVFTWTIGFLADRFQKKLFAFNGISMLFLGLTVIYVSFCTRYMHMMGSSVVFGAFVSSNYVLQSVLLTQLFPDPNKFAISYAMISMLEGAATFIVPPIIGKIRDYSGNYHSVFIVSGVILLVSAILSFYTEYLVHHEKRNSRSPSRNSKDVPLLIEQV